MVNDFTLDLGEVGASPSQIKRVPTDAELLQNLGSFRVLPPAHDLDQVLSWVKNVSRVSTRSFVSVFSAIEHVIFTVFRKDKALSLSEVETLEALLLQYKSDLRNFLADSSLSGMFDEVELRGRETLIFWVGYCLFFEAAKKEVPMVSKYAVCLDPISLRHLYLRHNEECETLKLVFKYLEKNSGDKPPLFHLSNSYPTIEFAEAYSQQSDSVKQILSSEMMAAEARKLVRWNKIKAKQEKAASIRQTISSDNSDLQVWKNTLATEQALSRERYYSQPESYRYCRSIPTSPEEKAAKSKIHALESSIRQNKNQLNQTLRPPHEIRQPLPRSEALAYRVLFFLHMPKILQTLSNFGCVAQRMLLPRSLSDSAFTVSSSNRSTWYEYYNRHSHTTTCANKGSFFLEYATGKVPNNFGESSVDRITSMENGVWYTTKFVND